MLIACSLSCCLHLAGALLPFILMLAWHYCFRFRFSSVLPLPEGFSRSLLTAFRFLAFGVAGSFACRHFWRLSKAFLLFFHFSRLDCQRPAPALSGFPSPSVPEVFILLPGSASPHCLHPHYALLISPFLRSVAFSLLFPSYFIVTFILSSHILCHIIMPFVHWVIY